MSNLQRADNLKQIVQMVEPDFNALAKIHNAVHYQREASFALQALKDNSFLAQVASGDPDSLKRAIINVAAIGLTLSPVSKLAYLIPRKGKVCLDVSYRGYIQLATDVGAIKWAIAEIVCKKDKFKFKGVNEKPAHEFNPFDDDRGPMVGAYCLAKTHDGEFLLTHMKACDIFAIRDRSESWKSFTKDKSKLSPWNTDEGEMVKKTLIRRAWKSWPATDTRTNRLAEAMAIDVADDTIDVTPALPEPQDELRIAAMTEIREILKAIDRTEEKFVEHLIRVNRRDLKKIEDLTPIEAEQAIIMLKQIAENKAKANEAAK